MKTTTVPRYPDVRRILRTALRTIGETLFPPNCWITYQPTTWIEGGLSLPVRERIASAMARPYCRQCGASLGPWTLNHGGCQRCRHRNLGVSVIARVGTFETPLAPLLYRLKFGRHWQIAPLLAGPLLQALQQMATQTDLPVDAIIPIPLHWMRSFTRGFNQAEELAWHVARQYGAPMLPALVRHRHTMPQSRISSRTARLDNLRGAFSVRSGYSFGGATVWLIDDICTTGSTLHAAATALSQLPKADRPAQICAAVVAVTDHTPPPISQ